MEFPFEMKNVTEDEDKIIKKYYRDYKRPFIRVGPSGYLAMAGYGDHAREIYNLEVRPTDVWVTSFSRSGTTWLEQLVWLVHNDLDYDALKEIPLSHRFAYIEFPTQAAEVPKPPSNMSINHRATIKDFKTLHEMPSPRYVKSHLPLSLLPPKLLDTAKVFYIARDPRDVVVSFHFAHKLFRYFDDQVTIKEFWELFKNNLIMHTPLDRHVLEAWNQRQHNNLMFLFYEDLQKDLLGVINKVCSYLSKEYSSEQKHKLMEHLSFDAMKKTDIFKSNKDGSNEKTFFRKGKSGGWMDYFDDQMRDEADKYIENIYKHTDMRYPDLQ